MSTQVAPAPARSVAFGPSELPPVGAPRWGEAERLAVLRGSGVLASRPQGALDALARAAAALCQVPIGLVNFLDETSQTTAASAGWLQQGFPAVIPRSDSVCQYTISTPGELLEIGDLTRDARTNALPAVAAGLRFYTGARVVSTDHAPLGVMCVLDRESRELTPTQRDGLRDLAAAAAALIELHGVAQRLIGVADRLGQEAYTDPLTGLYNRRALEPVLANLPPRTVVAMLDLDRFKQLNDRVGHDAGDRALAGYADLFRSALRDSDVAARWGGEEFLLILDDSGDPQRVLRRLHDTARATQPVTFSAGLTIAGPGEDPQQLLQRADGLLYRSKRAGRDRTTTDLPH